MRRLSHDLLLTKYHGAKLIRIMGNQALLRVKEVKENKEERKKEKPDFILILAIRVELAWVQAIIF